MNHLCKEKQLPCSVPTNLNALEGTSVGHSDNVRASASVRENWPVASLRPACAARYVGIGLSTLWDRINPNSPRYDAGFPSAIKLGERSRAFLRAELDDWLAQKAAERNQESAS